MDARHEGIAWGHCSCGRRIEPGQYVCKSCAQSADRMRIVAKARFRLPKKWARMGREGNLCSLCPKLEECRDCAKDGRVLACEKADERDGMGVRLQ